MSPEHRARYRSEAPLGRGGMGEVHKAWDRRLGRWVALKSVHPHRPLTSDLRARLAREARAAAALNHPAVAQIHDLITIDDRDYLVLEYVEGENLATVMRSQPLTLEAALRLATGIAAGLAAAHAAGIVHRDLKAENVVVTPEGRPKILDFGLATPIPSGEAGGDEGDPKLSGTLTAMAPEQVEHGAADARSDLFSLGTLLYEMFTHEHPFAAAIPAETARRIVFDEPPRAVRVNPKVPAVISTLIARLLSKTPERRPGAEEAAAILRAHATGITQAVAVASARARRWYAALAIVFVAAAAGLWLVHRSATETAVLYVAVRRPVIEGVEPTEALEQAVAGVRVAVINTLAGLVGTFALEERDVDAVSGEATAVAQAMAAGEVLEISVTGEGAFGRATISRIHGGDGHTVWAGDFDIPLDNMKLLSDTVNAQLRGGFDDRTTREHSFASTASAEDYSTYLEVYRRFQEQRGSEAGSEQLLHDLAAIRRSSPHLLGAYVTEARIAASCYRAQQKQEFLEHAREVSEQVLALAPEEPTVLACAITVAETGGDADRAAALLDTLERVAPLHPTLPWVRSWIAQIHDRRDEAIAIMTAEVARRPSWINLYALARLELREGRIADSRRHLERVLELGPEIVDALSLLAELELLHGPPERAEELYLQLVALAPEPRYQINLAVAQLVAGRYEKAATRFEHLLDRLSRHPSCLLNLADCYYLMGDVDRARHVYREAAERFGAFGETITPEQLAALAQAQLGGGDPTAAVATIQEALRRTPRSPDVNLFAALVYAAVGDTSSALVYVKSAVELGVNPHWFHLAWFDGLRSLPRFVELVPEAAGGAASGS